MQEYIIYTQKLLVCPSRETLVHLSIQQVAVYCLEARFSSSQVLVFTNLMGSLFSAIFVKLSGVNLIGAGKCLNWLFSQPAL